jgi:hypothetical protein
MSWPNNTPIRPGDLTMSESINFEDEIVRLLEQEPFHPFIIVVASGDRYEVTDPHAVAIGQSTLIVMHPRSGSSWIRKNHIVAITSQEPAA